MTTPSTTTTSKFEAQHVEQPQTPIFLKVHEIARRLGVGKTALYSWLSRGDIAYNRVGRAIRIQEADVETFLARTRVESRTSHL
jgi:excisionase family DNA binding protein